MTLLFIILVVGALFRAVLLAQPALLGVALEPVVRTGLRRPKNSGARRLRSRAGFWIRHRGA